MILQQARLTALNAYAVVVEREYGGATGALHILAVVDELQGIIGATAVFQAHRAHTVVGTQTVECGASYYKTTAGSHVGI